MTAPIRKPCRHCPWRADQHAQAIPNFSLELAERLAPTSINERGFGAAFGAPMFACHQSGVGEEIVCAGWLATQGSGHPNARMAYPREALSPGADWPTLHETFAEMIEKLRRDMGDPKVGETER